MVTTLIKWCRNRGHFRLQFGCAATFACEDRETGIGDPLIPPGGDWAAEVPEGNTSPSSAFSQVKRLGGGRMPTCEVPDAREMRLGSAILPPVAGRALASRVVTSGRGAGNRVHRRPRRTATKDRDAVLLLL